MDQQGIAELINKQADDARCWQPAVTEQEAYLQRQLRLLHAKIEGTDFFGFPLEGKN